MTTLTTRSKNIINIVLLISMLFIPLQVFAYTLQIKAYDGTSIMSQTGVAIKTYIPSTGYWFVTPFYGLPPPSFNQFFTNYQMPMGADYSVCAFYLNTPELIGCEFFYRSTYKIGISAIDLSPWN
jgi:hypothetical protein